VHHTRNSGPLGRGRLPRTTRRDSSRLERSSSAPSTAETPVMAASRWTATAGTRRWISAG